MLDLRWLNDNFDEVRQRLATRKSTVDFNELASLIERRRELIHKAESTRHRQRQAETEMKALPKGSDEFEARRAELRELANLVKALDEQRKAVVAEFEAMALLIPNVCHPSVPVGESDADNREVRRVGEPRTFDFEPRHHADIGEMTGLLDFAAGAKVTAARFTFLLGAAARLNRVLIDFMLELHTQEHGYTEMVPPFLVNRQALVGTSQLPKFEEEVFKTDEFFLIPTAEVPVTNYHAGEILDEARLPVRYVAYSPCFRREAGSYGQDTRGLIRQHQFEKVELVKLVHPSQSYDELEALVRDAERVLQLLELPYRAVVLSTGDTGFGSAKTYDLEVWLPNQQRYREISSCSNFEAFQARRANIRFRPAGGDKPEFVHTLNGSGLAIGRTLVAIIENYQNADGSVTVPKVLVERFGSDRIEPPKGA